MSEIVNYSLKIDMEQRDLLQKKIAESEMTAGNFLAAMLANYEAAQSRESLSDIRELNQLRTHLARIEEIYIGLAKSRKDIEDSHDHNINDLQDQLVVVKAALLDTQTTSKAEVEVIKKQMKELIEKTNEEKTKTQLELADLKEQKAVADQGQRQAVKIANLTEQTLGQLQEQIVEYKRNVSAYQQQAAQANDELTQTTIKLNAMALELTATKSQLEREREDCNRSVADQLQRSELDLQKAILLTQQTSLEKRESLQDEIVRLRDQLALERERIAQMLITSQPTVVPKQNK